jgi:hypothetical protein
MVNGNVVNKVDKTGKRGSKVYYALTEASKSQHQLRILKVDEDYEKKRSLYQILLYFHNFKRDELLTQRQLNNKLKIKLGFEELDEVNNSIAKDLNRVTIKIGNSKYTQISSFTNSYRNIEIIKYIKKGRKSITKSDFVYYLFMKGFTKDEFITYIKKLKKNSEPRPFSKYPPLVPHVFYREYTDVQIEEAIQLFYNAKLIKIIPSVFPEEIRYDISDDWLAGFITMVRRIQEIIFHKIIAKMSYIEKPTKGEIQILEFFLVKGLQILPLLKHIKLE